MAYQARVLVIANQTADSPELVGMLRERQDKGPIAATLLMPARRNGYAGKEEAGIKFADYFNAMPKYVVSSTLKDPEWNNTTVLSGDVVDEVRKLKQQHERDIVVHGSPQLAQTLIEHDLVDALNLLVYPVIVGAGKRLFDGTSETKGLRLAEARTFGDGVQLLVYERAA